MLLLQAELVALNVTHDVVAFAALLDQTDFLGPETDGAFDRSINRCAPLLVGCAPRSTDGPVSAALPAHSVRSTASSGARNATTDGHRPRIDGTDHLEPRMVRTAARA